MHRSATPDAYGRLTTGALAAIATGVTLGSYSIPTLADGTPSGDGTIDGIGVTFGPRDDGSPGTVGFAGATWTASYDGKNQLSGLTATLGAYSASQSAKLDALGQPSSVVRGAASPVTFTRTAARDVVPFLAASPVTIPEAGPAAGADGGAPIDAGIDPIPPGCSVVSACEALEAPAGGDFPCQPGAIDSQLVESDAYLISPDAPQYAKDEMDANFTCMTDQGSVAPSSFHYMAQTLYVRTCEARRCPGSDGGWTYSSAWGAWTQSYATAGAYSNEYACWECYPSDQQHPFGEPFSPLVAGNTYVTFDDHESLTTCPDHCFEGTVSLWTNHGTEPHLVNGPFSSYYPTPYTCDDWDLGPRPYTPPVCGVDAGAAPPDAGSDGGSTAPACNPALVCCDYQGGAR